LRVNVIVFDLDDTLYDEITFVYSGFDSVASYFSIKHKIDKKLFYRFMIDTLQKEGRGKVFDETLKYFEIYSKTNVKKALNIYRTHKPNIFLKDEIIELLKYYNEKSVPLYIVTDGNKIVQKNKIKSLNLEKYIKKIFITHHYGKKHSKPSTYCFEKIAQIEKVEYKNIVYIGDNINKDFINIKKLGFQTIRINQGMFKDLNKPQEFHANIDIEYLTQIKNILKV